ncbi:hypothetical protein NKH18_37355 [Streptomyces sp. M10(2022)]
MEFKEQPGAVDQVWAGTMLLWVRVTGAQKVDNVLVKDMASLFTECAEQVQNGDTASATLAR